MDPAIYGRASAGHRLTSAMYQPAETTRATPDISSALMRRPILNGAATRNANASPGTGRNACSILVRKAKPTTTPVAVIQRAETAKSFDWMARTVQ